MQCINIVYTAEKDEEQMTHKGKTIHVDTVFCSIKPDITLL